MVEGKIFIVEGEFSHRHLNESRLNMASRKDQAMRGGRGESDGEREERGSRGPRGREEPREHLTQMSEV